MAEPLKHELNESFIRRLGQDIAERDESFELDGFLRSILNENWEDRALKDRMRHTTHMIHAHTSLSYPEQLRIMVALSPGYRGLSGMVFPDYVEVYGLDYLKESLAALKAMTSNASAEFAIRPYIVRHEKATMQAMLDWSGHENEHLRRLASEGSRPRLPWAMALPAFKKDPTPAMAILENLKNDESLYVRKSVANHINDISKDNEEIALSIARQWYGQHRHTNWIIKHGLRGLLRTGNQQALQLIGFDDTAKFTVSDLKLLDRKVKIGEEVIFDFQLCNQEPDPSFAKIGFVVTYQKARGKRSDKIFHVTEKEFTSGQTVTFRKRISLRDLTTRKHYPGLHKIGILVNGKKLREEEFELIPG